MVLEALKNNKKAVGAKQSVRAVEAGTAKTVFLARDADEKVLAALKQLCEANAVETLYADSMKQLGKACGIEVGAAAVAILK